MAGLRGRRLPNTITVGRIVVTPAVFFLPFQTAPSWRFVAFFLFLVAALSDLWDGYLARKHGWISDFGKFMDPLADKLLMVATLVPLYMISNPPEPATRWPLWGSLPLWAILVVFAREVLITAIRTLSARRGIIIPAGKAGKYKAFAQNVFVGTGLLWLAVHSAAASAGWSGPVWRGWLALHGFVLALSLVVALFLTVLSLGIYLWQWRALVREAL